MQEEQLKRIRVESNETSKKRDRMSKGEEKQKMLEETTSKWIKKWGAEREEHPS